MEQCTANATTGLKLRMGAGAGGTGRKMSAADKRIDELLDRWLASVELHATYLELDDAAYAKLQAWPRHQRPTRWIVELARSRLDELRRQVAAQRAKGDSTFAESLELMGFLTTLLGSEHVERFIPQPAATSQDSAPDATAPTVEAPRPSVEPTVIRPRTAKAPAARAREPSAAAKTAVTRPKAPVAPAKAPAAQVKTTAAPAKPAKAQKPDKTATTVIADAARLLSWGREWPQLASLIARLADRPSEQEVWAILRTHREAILAKARSIPD